MYREGNSVVFALISLSRSLSFILTVSLQAFFGRFLPSTSCLWGDHYTAEEQLRRRAKEILETFNRSKQNIRNTNCGQIKQIFSVGYNQEFAKFWDLGENQKMLEQIKEQFYS